MALYRSRLPQLDADLFLTDGGIETTLIHIDGFDLPEFAAFPLLDDARGRTALDAYFGSYCEIAARDGCGIVLETPTWRASQRWGSALSYSSDDLVRINHAAVEMLISQRDRHATAATPIVVSGCIGPAGDGYLVGDVLTADEARAYHSAQIATFAATEADLVSALTLNYVDEAIGIVRAAADVAMPVVVSFTVETDGHLAAGMSIGEAIQAVDDASDGYPAYFMINCAHPSHFAAQLDAEASWAPRLQGIRANASARSHAELDESDALDRGDPIELAQGYRELRSAFGHLRVAGGCCGTDTEHVAAISDALR